MMIPPGKGIEKCSCGNLFDIVTLESRNPVIHHSKPTHDSRTGLLSVHFLETSNCDCKQWYHGEHDRLVRTSPAPSTVLGNWRKVNKRMTLKTNVKFTFVMVLTWGICNMKPREWWRRTFSRFQRCPQVCIICICSLRHLTIFCQHF